MAPGAALHAFVMLLIASHVSSKAFIDWAEYLRDNHLQPSGVQHAANLIPSRRLLANITFVKTPAVAATCGVIYNIALPYARWDAALNRPRSLPIKYINLTLHALRAAKLRLSSSDDRLRLTKQLCVEPIQFGLYLDPCVWTTLPTTEQTRLTDALDVIGLYPEIPEVSPLVPVKLPFMQLDPTLWMRRYYGLMTSPFRATLMLDQDAMPCQGDWDKAFGTVVGHDVSTYIPGTKYAGSCNNRTHPYPPYLKAVARNYSSEALRLWDHFGERNLGTILFDFKQAPAVHLMLFLVDTFVRQVWDFQATGFTNQQDKTYCIHHDQVAIREALFLLRNHVKEGTLQPLVNRIRRFWRTTAVFFHCPNAVHITKSSYRYCAASNGRNPPFQSRVPSPDELAAIERQKKKRWLEKTGRSSNSSGTVPEEPNQ